MSPRGRAVCLCLALAAAGCGPDEPDNRIALKYGCMLDAHGVPGLPTIEEHNEALDAIVGEAGKLMPSDQVAAAIGRITIQWWDILRISPSTGHPTTVVVFDGQPYSGLTVGHLCMVAWRGEIHGSAFVHEIMHVVGGDVLGDWNADHSNETLRGLEASINAGLARIGL